MTEPNMVSIIPLRVEALKMAIDLVKYEAIQPEDIEYNAQEFLKFLMYGSTRPQNENTNQS